MVRVDYALSWYNELKSKECRIVHVSPVIFSLPTRTYSRRSVPESAVPGKSISQVLDYW
jgi:hypothetical protein